MKIAVITGASGGLGKALVQEFARHGWQVIGTGRSDTPEHMPNGTLYHQFDASNAAKCESFWQHVHTKYSNAQICLVNNAGGYMSGQATELSPNDYELQMKSSYFSSVYMTKGLIKVFSKGRIINVISSSALAPHKNGSAYGAAKAAQKYFFQALQEEVTPNHYQITNLYPFNISSEGPADNAMTSEDLATFVHEQAINERTYYLRDVTVWPN